VNLAAAEEIARQLRLRDMGGIIVVDFIDMHQNEHKQMVFDKIRTDMSFDRAKHNILPLSKFGLMQITRQRVRPEMNIDVVEKCPTCKGTGEITPSILIIEEIENKLAYQIEKKDLSRIIVKTHPFVASFITRGLYSTRVKWMLKYRCWISVKKSFSFSMLEYQFFNSKRQIISD